jgi:hypothetical protein
LASRLYLAPILRRVVLVSEPALRQGFNLQRISLCSIDGADY